MNLVMPASSLLAAPIVAHSPAGRGGRPGLDIRRIARWGKSRRGCWFQRPWFGARRHVTDLGSRETRAKRASAPIRDKPGRARVGAAAGPARPVSRNRAFTGIWCNRGSREYIIRKSGGNKRKHL